jgi:hypothetical protein
MFLLCGPAYSLVVFIMRQKSPEVDALRMLSSCLPASSLPAFVEKQVHCVTGLLQISQIWIVLIKIGSISSVARIGDPGKLSFVISPLLAASLSR